MTDLKLNLFLTNYSCTPTTARAVKITSFIELKGKNQALPYIVIFASSIVIPYEKTAKYLSSYNFKG